jgi:hypothetical protein
VSSRELLRQKRLLVLGSLGILLLAAAFLWIWLQRWDVATISAVAASAAAVAAAAAGAITFHQAQLMAQVSRQQVDATILCKSMELLNDLRSESQTTDFLRAKSHAAKSLLSGRKCRELVRIMNFYETIGTMVEKHGLDEDLVYSYFSDAVLHWYPAMLEMIERDAAENPTYWENFSKLHARMVAIEERKHGNPRPGMHTVLSFLRVQTRADHPTGRGALRLDGGRSHRHTRGASRETATVAQSQRAMHLPTTIRVAAPLAATPGVQRG